MAAVITSAPRGALDPCRGRCRRCCSCRGALVSGQVGEALLLVQRTGSVIRDCKLSLLLLLTPGLGVEARRLLGNCSEQHPSPSFLDGDWGPYPAQAVCRALQGGHTFL